MSEQQKINYWEELFRLRDEDRQRLKNGVKVIRGKEVPLENNRQGLMKWYLHPSIYTTALRSLIVYVQEIPPGSRSGRLHTPGGESIYIIKGKGHTIIDGVRYDWQAGDALNLPLKRDGIVVQHFNDDPNEPVRFISTSNNWVDCVGVDRGAGFEQLENSPDYKPEEG